MTVITKEKSYSIGEAAKLFHLSVPTLRYYDQEGLIPNLSKDESGNRRFTQENLDALQMIECLKAAKMPIKDIKQFMEWNVQGDQTLIQREQLFNELAEKTQKRIDQLELTMKVIRYKQGYYKKAVADGTEKYVKEHSKSVTELVKGEI